TAVPVGRHDVQFAIPVEVAQRQLRRPWSGKGRAAWLEGAVPVAQENADGTIPEVGDADIELAVVVEVADGDPVGGASYGVVSCRLKRAIAVIEKTLTVPDPQLMAAMS